MGKIIKCRIDLNQYEAIKEGDKVVFDSVWDLPTFPFVRPSFSGQASGTAVTTEKIWDRHRLVTWFTPWRIFTQPFRPAIRFIWVNLLETVSEAEPAVYGRFTLEEIEKIRNSNGRFRDL